MLFDLCKIENFPPWERFVWLINAMAEQGMQTSRMTPHTSAYRPVQVMKDDDGDAYLQKKKHELIKMIWIFGHRKERDGLDESVKPVLEFASLWDNLGQRMCSMECGCSICFFDLLTREERQKS